MGELLPNTVGQAKTNEGRDKPRWRLYGEYPPSNADELRKKAGRYTREEIGRITNSKEIEDAFFSAFRTCARETSPRFGDPGYAITHSVLKAENQEAFSSIVLPFINSVWKNRGNLHVTYPDAEERSRIEKQLDEKEDELKVLESRWSALTRNMRLFGRGRKSAATQKNFSNVNTERGEVEEKIKKLSGKDYEMYRNETALVTEDTQQHVRPILERHSEIGRLKCRLSDIEKRQRAYDGAVFAAERLSSDEFAVLISELLEQNIDSASKQDPSINPEIVDFLNGSIDAWATSHKNESALLPTMEATKS